MPIRRHLRSVACFGRGPMKIFLRFAAGLIVILTVAWAMGAIYYWPIADKTLRTVLAAGFILATALAFFMGRCRGRIFLLYLLVFGTLVALWFRIPASNERNWQTEVAVTPSATIQGDTVTIHGVRNFNYRSETDFDVRWEDRTYRLSDLDSADLIAVYWAGKAIAHIMLSFGFRGKEHVSISIETARRKGRSSTRRSRVSFDNTSFIMSWPTSATLFEVRTTYRHPQEDVYVYRLRTSRENIRRVSLDYLKTINELHERPRFYNTLTTNCTTNILMHSRVNPGSPPMSWKVLLSGYVPDYLYELGRLDGTTAFPELEAASRVNDRANAADRDAAFSARIREGLPVPRS